MLVDLIMWTFQALRKRKTKNNMSTQQQDTTQAEVFYVWGKSERAGDIVQEDTTKPDAKWMNFTDGTRCNRELVDEYLLKTSSEQEAKNLAISFNPTANVNANRSTNVETKATTAPTAPTAPPFVSTSYDVNRPVAPPINPLVAQQLANLHENVRGQDAQELLDALNARRGR